MKYQGKITDPKDLVTKEYVDTGLSGKLGTSGDGSNVTAAFNAASSRTNISTGEKLTVIFGKIAKWFADLGTAAFRGVDSAPTDNSTNLVESGGVKSAIANVAENFADVYDSTASYVVGNMCVHDNILYRCTTDIASGGETWNAAHWEATQVEGSINGAIGAEIAAGTDISTITAPGRYYSPSGTRTATLTGLPKNMQSVGFTMDVLCSGGIFRREIFVGSSFYPRVFIQNFHVGQSIISSWIKLSVETSNATVTAEVYGNFYAAEVIADAIYFKILWPKIWDLPSTTSFTLGYKSTVNNDTTRGMYVSDGANALSTGWTFNTPYIGGHRMITIKADKTNHGLTHAAMINVPSSNAITVTYANPI